MRAFKIVEAYAASGAVQDAFKALEQVTKKLNEQTMIHKLCTTCNKHYGKASHAAIEACIKVLTTLRMALTYKDIRKESHQTDDVLTGKGVNKDSMCPDGFQKIGIR